jgi:hypothetical protein
LRVNQLARELRDGGSQQLGGSLEERRNLNGSTHGPVAKRNQQLPGNHQMVGHRPDLWFSLDRVILLRPEVIAIDDDDDVDAKTDSKIEATAKGTMSSDVSEVVPPPRRQSAKTTGCREEGDVSPSPEAIASRDDLLNCSIDQAVLGQTAGTRQY